MNNTDALIARLRGSRCALCREAAGEIELLETEMKEVAVRSKKAMARELADIATIEHLKRIIGESGEIDMCPCGELAASRTIDGVPLCAKCGHDAEESA